MNLLESIQMAGKTLLSNKLRSSLTMLGIVIGNASVITMIGIGEGAQKFVTQKLESLGPNVLFVLPGNNSKTRKMANNVSRTLVLSDAKAIASSVPTITGVCPELNAKQVITYQNRSSDASIIGTTPSFLAVRDYKTELGRFFTEIDINRSSQVVVLGADLAKTLFNNLNPIGQQLRIGNTSFQVIGVLKAKGSTLGIDYDAAALIPIATSANRIVGRNSPYGIALDYIVVAARDADSVEAAEFQITNLLRLRHKIINSDDFTIRSQKDALQTVGQITSALTIMLGAIAGISLIVGGIGIMNIMLASVAERTQEIGLRKAIGATHQNILIQFMSEALIVSAVGGLIGTFVGVGGVMLVATLTPLKAGISVVTIMTTVSISGGIGLFFGVFPARYAAKLDPIVALRSA